MPVSKDEDVVRVDQREPRTSDAYSDMVPAGKRIGKHDLDSIGRTRAKHRWLLPTLIAGCTAVGLVVGGFTGYTVAQTDTATAIEQGVNAERSLDVLGLASLPEGFTGRQLLERKRVEEAAKEYSAISKEIADTLSAELGLTFEENPEGATQINSSGDGKGYVYQATSAMYSAIGQELTEDQRRQAIKIVNGIVTRYQFNAFQEPASIDSAFLSIAGIKNGGNADAYIVSIAASSDPTGEIDPESEFVSPASISVVFHTFPFIKTGEEEAFKARVLKDYLANNMSPDYIQDQERVNEEPPPPPVEEAPVEEESTEDQPEQVTEIPDGSGSE